MRIRHLVPILAALLLSASVAAYAKPNGEGEGMSKSGNQGGNGNSGGDHGNQGSGAAPGNSGDKGNSGGTKLKVHPPQGTCTASDSLDGLDLQGPEGQSGASHVAHTDFGMIDPATGEPVASPSSATMMYFWYGSTFDFVLNAHQLPAGSEWTLTYQPEPLPSSGVMCLGNATVNGGGQLHLAGSVELDSNLPPNLDPTADPSTQPDDALLALVLS
ncbi:MAG TPA: hypothetical protein VLC97_14040, partial [Rhodanobacteraceae bacterium]|nr:hypothetical protein [Rhodanobacteraceae bacterium]